MAPAMRLKCSARYRNAICLVWADGRVYEKMDDSLASEEFWIVEKKYPRDNPGFPLDSLSVNPRTGKYYYEDSDRRLDQFAVRDGFFRFFEKVLTLEGICGN